MDMATPPKPGRFMGEPPPNNPPPLFVPPPPHRAGGHRPPQGPCLGLVTAEEEAKGAFFGAALFTLRVLRMRHTTHPPMSRKSPTAVPAIFGGVIPLGSTELFVIINTGEGEPVMVRVEVKEGVPELEGVPLGVPDPVGDPVPVPVGEEDGVVVLRAVKLPVMVEEGVGVCVPVAEGVGSICTTPEICIPYAKLRGARGVGGWTAVGAGQVPELIALDEK